MSQQAAHGLHVVLDGGDLQSGAGRSHEVDVGAARDEELDQRHARAVGHREVERRVAVGVGAVDVRTITHDHLHAAEVIRRDGGLHEEVVEDEGRRDALAAFRRQAHPGAEWHQLGGRELGGDLLLVPHDEIVAALECVEHSAFDEVAVHAARHDRLAHGIRRALGGRLLEKLLHEAEHHLEHTRRELRVGAHLLDA